MHEHHYEYWAFKQVWHCFECKNELANDDVHALFDPRTVWDF